MKIKRLNINIKHIKMTKINCPSCNKLFTQKTINKYNGTCGRCAPPHLKKSHIHESNPGPIDRVIMIQNNPIAILVEALFSLFK